MTGKEPESLRRCVPSAATEPTRRQGATRVFARRADALGEARLIVGRQMQLTAVPLRQPRATPGHAAGPAAGQPGGHGVDALAGLARRWLKACLDQPGRRRLLLGRFRARAGKR